MVDDGSSDDGCGCRAAGVERSGHSGLALLMLAAVAWRRRRVR
jgi:MYXO-CTERM domain-containing protein